MKILFAGTPAIGIPTLAAIAEKFKVVAVLTNPDTPSGRNNVPIPSPIKEHARKLGIPVVSPSRLGTAERTKIKWYSADILVSFAYGRIFGPKFLSVFPFGGINVHPSLLPKYRGPSPISAAILAGESKTGISVQRTALEMDCGAVLGQVQIELNGTETGGSLTENVSILAAPLLVHVLEQIENGSVKAVEQDDDLATYCSLLKKEHGRISWSQSAESIEAMIRAYLPWPRAYTNYEGKSLSFLEASVIDSDGTHQPGKVITVDKSKGILIQTGHGLLAVTRLQLQAKKAMFWHDFINGNRSIVGTVLGG